MKKCNKCEIEKPLDEFFNDSKNKVDGKYTLCKSCKKAGTEAWRQKNKAHCAKLARNWRSRNIEKNRWYDTTRSLRGLYGITLQEYLDMLEKQNHRCLLCGNTEGRSRRGLRMKLAVDHCHTTKKVRGLLCSDCNCALGYFNDDPKRMEKAIEYLKTHNPSLRFKHLDTVES